MQTITAREAVPGTRIVVDGLRDFAVVTVQRWEPSDIPGWCKLVCHRGLCRGRYPADHVFELAG